MSVVKLYLHGGSNLSWLVSFYNCTSSLIAVTWLFLLACYISVPIRAFLALKLSKLGESKVGHGLLVGYR